MYYAARKYIIIRQAMFTALIAMQCVVHVHELKYLRTASESQSHVPRVHCAVLEFPFPSVAYSA